MRYPLHSLIRMPLRQHLFVFASLFLIVQRGQTQGNIYTESFPNSFNTGFTTPIPSSSYTGSSGTWTFSSNDRATVVCNNAFYQSSPYAMKLVNYSTSGYPTSTSKSVSPNYNMSAWGCSNNVNVNFRLYTYTLNASNSCYSLYVDFSSDGGATWSTVWQKTAAQIISAYGSGTWNTITVAMPLAYRTTNFKVRFRGVQNAGCNYNSYVFIDDIKMYAEACTGPVGSIGDRVWLDADGDGIQDASETGGITGVTVQLKNSAGTVIATTTTNASGNYSFTGLAAGNYKVVFPASISGAIVTGQDVGGDDNVDSDPSQATGETGTITLASGQNITNVDAGYCPTTLALGNKVWYDTNNNGLESSENGIANITVKLYKDDNNDNVADGASIATTTTNSSGNYLFSNLGPGNYIVGVIIPNGYMSSSVNGGDPDNNINLDDNGQVLAGNEIRGQAITLVAGTEPNGNTNNTYDFGLLPDCSCTTSASNLLVNGSFESGTTGWSWSNGTLTTGTGYIACGLKNGFNSWSSGTSKVWQDVAVAAGSVVTFKGFAGTHTGGLTCSPKLSLIFLNASNTVLGQSDVTVTKDVTINFGQLDEYTITATAPAGTTKVRVQSSITCNTMKIDAFCLTATTPPASVGDFVWQDLNADGIQDAGEPGIPNVTVVLKDNIGNTVGTTTTNASGAYSFTNLVPGTYSVTFTTPSGFIASPSNVGSDDTKDSDPIAGEVSGIVLTAGLNNTTIDAGFIRLINLSGNVWHDANAFSDGLVNSTSPVLIPPGLRAYLVNASTGLIEQVVFVNTSTGTFSFSNVNVNSVYNVVLSSSNQIIGNPPPAATLPSGWIHTGQKNANPPNSPAGSDGLNDGKVVVPTGTTDVININFGIKQQGGDVVLG